MKYNFVYDKEFRDRFAELTKEEISVVLATIVGRHNAIFWGYKPERLVNAIEKLCDCPFVNVKEDGYIEKANGGVLYTPTLDSFDMERQNDIYAISQNGVKKFQVVATCDMGVPAVKIIPNLLGNFDIVYKCKFSLANDVGNMSTTWDKLRDKVSRAIRYKKTLHSGKHITSDFTMVKTYWNRMSFQERYISAKEKNENLALKIAKVARSISDITDESMTTDFEWGIAKTWYDEGVEYEI
jgi:hypothetical protein